MSLGQASSASPYEAPRLTDVQEGVLDLLRRDGIAVVPFQELFPDERLWDELEADVAEFTRETEARTDELLEREEGKNYIARRFVQRSGEQKPKKWKFRLGDRWLSLGLSNEILGVVNSYRGERTRLIDLDNWYTIPDPRADERIESQRWHRDPWDNHIVKVFTYFSDVDHQAGPFEYVLGSPAGGRYGHLWPFELKGIYPPQEELEAAVAPEDKLTVTGPAGTIFFCDTSGFHRGGWARSKPRVLSYHTYVSASATKSPRFRVDWKDDGADLLPAAEFAIAWSRKKKKTKPAS